MKNINKGLLFYFFLYWMTLPVLAMSFEDAQLLRKDYLLYQAWSVSRNYYFGTTIKQNKVYALAWQHIYTSLLPKTYPQKENLLDFYRNGLNAKELQNASEIADNLIKKYNLNSPLSEIELAQTYVLREENNHWSSLELILPSKEDSYQFKQWVIWLARNYDQSIAEQIDQYAYDLLSTHQLPIVYGQLNIKGPELPQMVATDVKIFPHGFFVGHPNKQELNFNLAGYKTARIKLNNKLIQPIPIVNLEQLSHNKQTGIIGRVSPWFGLPEGNIILIAETALANHQDEPWLQPHIPLTITENGEFYATGLVAGRYLLYINTVALSTKIKVTLKEGETRGLSLIKLEKTR
ncbi:hypothetical protein [Legionella gresilensis]|uniref:hypothetical protein n=1 Tax=Legionella gresilensis TaxID=91823 RepID=UPI001041772C|nr:hypothetical protein [Legionella gresilensis]